MTNLNNMNFFTNSNNINNRMNRTLNGRSDVPEDDELKLEAIDKMMEIIINRYGNMNYKTNFPDKNDSYFEVLLDNPENYDEEDKNYIVYLINNVLSTIDGEFTLNARIEVK